MNNTAAQERLYYGHDGTLYKLTKPLYKWWYIDTRIAMTHWLEPEEIQYN